jgi:hypothetical protein
MDEQDNLSNKQRLHLIEQMISAAKDEHRESGIPWLFWGSLLFGASVTSIVLMLVEKMEYISQVWSGMLVAGSVIYSIMAFTTKREAVKTYVEELLERFEKGFFISLFAMVAGLFLLDAGGRLFGFYYILYAFWLFIHGSAIRFRPLIIGAFFNWVAAILIFIMDDFLYSMIVSAIAIFIGFIVPGYLLRKQYIKQNKNK